MYALTAWEKRKWSEHRILLKKKVASKGHNHYGIKRGMKMLQKGNRRIAKKTRPLSKHHFWRVRGK